MRSHLVWLTLLAAAAGSGAAEDGKPAEPRCRTFRFTYAATLTGLKPGQPVRVWLPVPPSDDEQQVEVVEKDLPAEGHIDTERPNGNRVCYLEAKGDERGEVALCMVYRVKRREVRRESLRPKEGEAAGDVARLLEPNKRVPIAGRPLELIRGKDVPTDEMEAARFFYDLVCDHMRYDKPAGVRGWGEGDAVWACEKGFGNCTDFHSLFLSLARAHRVPAKFDIGFSLPARHGSGDVAGYHCWAWFRLRSGVWVPVDISEANKNPRLRDYFFGNLTEDRVAFSTGRDLTLVPPQAGPPLNFFIYPYAETDGEPYPASKVRCRFSFHDEL